jgi:ElaB/YqjD/DUF883 family membrane-anchored ribosome-binding protein
MDIRPSTERIVEEGRDIRGRVRELVESTTRRAGESADDLVALTRSALEGAGKALDRATPADPESPLHQVVDGLGDGLQRTAQAMSLAIEEAASEGRAYSQEDLGRMRDDLAALTRQFSDSVEQGAKSGSSLAREQLTALREHADRTLDAIKPSLERAIKAAEREPVKLAKESASAAASVTREAAGSLFRAVGDLFKSAGDKLSPRD